jgi:hypothetical protein
MDDGISQIQARRSQTLGCFCHFRSWISKFSVGFRKSGRGRRKSSLAFVISRLGFQNPAWFSQILTGKSNILAWFRDFQYWISKSSLGFRKSKRANRKSSLASAISRLGYQNPVWDFANPGAEIGNPGFFIASPRWPRILCP